MENLFRIDVPLKPDVKNNNIALNDFEYLLDADGELMIFESREKAQEFLKANGYTDDEISESIRFFTYDERFPAG